MIQRQITFDWELLFGIRFYLETEIKEIKHLYEVLREEKGEDHEDTILVKERVQLLEKQLERVNDGINS